MHKSKTNKPRFVIVRANLAREHADAIVTPAHRLPKIGCGADRAVHAAAGPELLEARRALGVLGPCDVRATPAGNLRAKYVLHALGPIWEGGERNEALLLRLAYQAVLREATALRCRSISIPLLSSGNYGFPPEEALDTAVAAIGNYLDGHPETELFVRLVVLDSRAYRHAREVFPDIVSSELSDAEVDALVSRSRPRPERTLDSEEGTDYYRDVEWRMRGETFATLYGRLLAHFLASEKAARAAAGNPKGARNPFATTKAAVARRADIDYEYFKRLCRPDSTVAPGKDKVLALAMAIRCGRRETTRLLRVSGHVLDPRVARDAFILQAIGTPVWDEARLSQELVVNGFMRLRVGE